MFNRLKNLATLGVAALMAGCSANNDTGRASVDAVTDTPDNYIGETISIRGEVDELQNDRRSFTVADHDWIFPEKLLVVTPRPISQMTGGVTLREEERVQVRGTVRRLVIAELERDYDFDLERDFELEFRERPVLVASSITSTIARSEKSAKSGDSATTPPVPPPADSALLERDLPHTPAGDTAVTTRAAGMRPVTNIVLILPIPGPRELIGQQVQLDDIPLRGKVGDRGYWVGPSEKQQVFVQLKQDAKRPSVAEGELVRLGGTLQPLPNEDHMIRQWQLDPSVAQKLTRNEALYIRADSLMAAGC